MQERTGPIGGTSLQVWRRTVSGTCDAEPDREEEPIRSPIRSSSLLLKVGWINPERRRRAGVLLRRSTIPHSRSGARRTVTSARRARGNRTGTSRSEIGRLHRDLVRATASQPPRLGALASMIAMAHPPTTRINLRSLDRARARLSRHRDFGTPRIFRTSRRRQPTASCSV